MFTSQADYGLTPGGIGPLLSRSAVPHTGASKAGQDYSELGAYGPDLPADFSGRTAASTVVLNVSDTASLSATEDPVDSQEISTSDTARLSVTDSAALFNFIQITDTASLLLSETVSLLQAGVLAKTPTDTASISVTEAVAIAVTLDVTDAADIEITDEASVATTVEQVSVTDTASIEVDEISTLEVFTGLVDISVIDNARLGVTESASAIEVRRIKRILMSIEHPRIDMEIL